MNETLIILDHTPPPITLELPSINNSHSPRQGDFFCIPKTPSERPLGYQQEVMNLYNQPVEKEGTIFIAGQSSPQIDKALEDIDETTYIREVRIELAQRAGEIWKKDEEAFRKKGKYNQPTRIAPQKDKEHQLQAIIAILSGSNDMLDETKKWLNQRESANLLVKTRGVLKEKARVIWGKISPLVQTPSPLHTLYLKQNLVKSPKHPLKK